MNDSARMRGSQPASRRVEQREQLSPRIRRRSLTHSSSKRCACRDLDDHVQSPMEHTYIADRRQVRMRYLHEGQGLSSHTHVVTIVHCRIACDRDDYRFVTLRVPSAIECPHRTRTYGLSYLVRTDSFWYQARHDPVHGTLRMDTCSDPHCNVRRKKCSAPLVQFGHLIQHCLRAHDR